MPLNSSIAASNGPAVPRLGLCAVRLDAKVEGHPLRCCREIKDCPPPPSPEMSAPSSMVLNIRGTPIPFILLTPAESDHAARICLRLTLSVDEEQFLQSQTPFKTFVDQYKNEWIYKIRRHDPMSGSRRGGFSSTRHQPVTFHAAALLLQSLIFH